MATKASYAKTTTKTTQEAKMIVESPDDMFIKILNYNVDGLGEDIGIRMREILRLILLQQPDVIALQEVTPLVHRCLCDQLKLHDYVDLSMYTSISAAPMYYSAIMAKRTLSCYNVRRIPFRCGSAMMRDILCITLPINGQNLSIMTSHLESCKESRSLRQQQFQEIFDHLIASKTPAVFCGDTNLSFDFAGSKRSDEDVAVGKGNLLRLEDAFSAKPLAKGQPAYTWRRLGTPGSRFWTSRFDRFYSNNQSISVDSYSVFGTEELPGIDITTAGYATPSDHYGVVVRYRIKRYPGYVPGSDIAESPSLFGSSGRSIAHDNEVFDSSLTTNDDIRAQRLKYFESLVPASRSNGENPALQSSTTKGLNNSRSSGTTIGQKRATTIDNMQSSSVCNDARIVDLLSDDDAEDAKDTKPRQVRRLNPTSLTEWTCHLCTLDNSIDTRICAACETPRRSSSSSSSSS